MTASQRWRARLRGTDVPLRVRPWTDGEISALRALYATGPLDRDGCLLAFARDIGRPFGAVAMKAHKLGLTSPRTLSRAVPDSSCMALSVAHEVRMRANIVSGHHRGHGGRRPDLGDRYFRSAWEANYARFLTWRKLAWEYESKTFRFEGIKRGTMSYTPDFWIPELREYHEVKGWMDQRSQTQLARMGRYFPDVRVVVIGRDWFKAARRQGLASVVPNWETLT